MSKDRLFSVAMGTLIAGAAWAGCSSSGRGSGSTASVATTGTGGSGGTGGAGGVTTITSSGAGGSAPDGGAGPFSCNVPPATPPSVGSCVTVVADSDAGTGIECNPVTNAPCAPGEGCDIETDSSNAVIGFICYPGPNTATVCQACDDSKGPTCIGGTTCFGTGSSAFACAQYCCGDADCGATGKCTTAQSGTSFFGPLAPGLGVCAAR